MVQSSPTFIAIVGYSFAWTGKQHNDAVSFDCFVDCFRKFTGPVFVVDPYPERLQETLSERLHATRISAVPARWNLLAHAFLDALAGRIRDKSLSDYCKRLIDLGHEWSAFPLLGERD